ncbi:protein jagunal homolog 1-A-like [Montipora capricornis]|uniref:protein jagunal homolog 1-A-like n=1 Tax=Montipora capricornis TaxID=246305 RepID=UPI0035F148E2
MASRDGPRAAGTDGSDFAHRQRIASHYKDSVQWKAKLKACLSFHVFLILCVGAWIAAAFSGLVKTKPQPWELAWLLSLVPAVVGLASITKNNVKQIYVCAGGILLVGVGPLVFGACLMIQEIVFSAKREKASPTEAWQSAPMKMAAVAFLIQFHGISLYYMNKLTSAWNAKGEKKTS